MSDLKTLKDYQKDGRDWEKILSRGMTEGVSNYLKGFEQFLSKLNSDDLICYCCGDNKVEDESDDWKDWYDDEMCISCNEENTIKTCMNCAEEVEKDQDYCSRDCYKESQL